MGEVRFIAAAVAMLLAMLALPPAASAAFHFMSIREVHPGGASGGSYVVLQMWSSGQNLVAGHDIDVYAANGTKTSTFTFPSNVSNGSNQATILAAGEGYATTFPEGPEPDAPEDSALSIPAAGGAVCFEIYDCVAWGNFTEGGSLPSSAGNPASPGGVTADKALHRTIEPNCATLLEPADDSGDSATDFSEQNRNPRNNSSPIIEEDCVAPTATIESAPPDPTSSTSASFTYSSDPAGAAFECSLDSTANADYESCPPSGTNYEGLAEGTHTFRVRAEDENGTGSPDAHEWTIDLTPPEVTITEAPDDPSHGGSASFEFHADETGVAFECSLVPAGEQDDFDTCADESPGITYNNLPDGEHVFKVRGTDAAGNQGDPSSHTWTVDNSLTDTTPPQTAIDSSPPNPSSSSTASFAYSSNEPGSTFECKLDAGDFESCPDDGITYTGLANGTHTFQVRAIDPSGNVDPTPAGYTFDVALVESEPEPEPEPEPDSEPEGDPDPDPEADPVILPGMAYAARTALARGRAGALRVLCRGQRGARCRGAMRLFARVRIGRGNRTRVRNVVIGGARSNLPARRSIQTVRLRLTGLGARLLRRAGRRGLRAILAGPGVKNRVVLLRPVGRRGR